MMKLFMVLVATGHIGGTWGPLPYGIDECQQRQAEFQAALNAEAATMEWRVSCEWHTTRPELGTPRKEPRP